MYRPAKNYSDLSFSRWIHTNPDLKISAIHLTLQDLFYLVVIAVCSLQTDGAVPLSLILRRGEADGERKALAAQHVASMRATKWGVVRYQALPWLCIRADYRAGRHPQTWSQHPLFSSHNWGMEGSPVWWPASTGAARQNKGTQLLESYSLWNLLAPQKKGTCMRVRLWCFNSVCLPI